MWVKGRLEKGKKDDIWSRKIQFIRDEEPYYINKSLNSLFSYLFLGFYCGRSHLLKEITVEIFLSFPSPQQLRIGFLFYFQKDKIEKKRKIKILLVFNFFVVYSVKDHPRHVVMLKRKWNICACNRISIQITDVIGRSTLVQNNKLDFNAFKCKEF